MNTATHTVHLELTIPRSLMAAYDQNPTAVRERLVALGVWPAQTDYARWRLDHVTQSYVVSLAVPVTAAV